MRLLKLVPEDTNIDFLRWRKVASAMSFLLVVISLALVAIRGLNFGVDFVGGQSVRVEFAGTMPEIEECHMMAAGFDYLLKVRTGDIADYRRVLGERISALPHVASTSTYVAMEAVKEAGL